MREHSRAPQRSLVLLFVEVLFLVEHTFVVVFFDVLAFVVFRHGAQASEKELASHCASRLASFKIPTQWRVIDALPRTPTQRIAYYRLR